jgi:hypothetical protein
MTQFVCGVSEQSLGVFSSGPGLHGSITLSAVLWHGKPLPEAKVSM